MLNDSDKQFINFLLSRWKLMIGHAAIERVCAATKDANNKLNTEQKSKNIPLACKQIDMIKKQIMEILPNSKFIDYTYKAPAPLDPNDFVEIFISDHHMCISKVKDLIERMDKCQ